MNGFSGVNEGVKIFIADTACNQPEFSWRNASQYEYSLVIAGGSQGSIIQVNGHGGQGLSGILTDYGASNDGL